MPPRIIKNDYTAPRPLASSLIRRAPPPSSSTGPSAPGAPVVPGSSAAAEDPETYLERAEKEWNERVDVEVEGLARGMRGLVEGIGNPSTPLTPLSLPLLSSGLRRNATDLLKISHELKLLLLLSIPDGSAEERARLEKDVEGLKKEVEGLLGGGDGDGMKEGGGGEEGRKGDAGAGVGQQGSIANEEGVVVDS